MNNAGSHRDQTLGLWLGVLGVAIFAVTLPATRLATGTAEQPQLSPWFVTLGRAALAGLLSAAFLLVTRSPRPERQHFKHLGWAVLGNTLGYPLLLAYALRSVTASHAAVVTALLPLVTAVVAVLVLQQRARLGFWVCAVLGSLLVVAFSLLRGWQQGHGFSVEAADALLVGAVVAASVGYIHGARITPALAAAAMEEVDSTPMEGFDNQALDEILDLRRRGLRSVAIMPLGYREADKDWLVVRSGGGSQDGGDSSKVIA